MLPRIGDSKLVSRWLVALIAVSVVAILDGGWLASWTALAPRRIWGGEVWRLVTWVFVERDPYSLLITGFCVYRFAGDLAPRWGDRRLRRFALQIVLAASIATTLLSLVSYEASAARWGGWVVVLALVIAWARQYPAARLHLVAGVELGGRQLVIVVVGINVLYALAGGPLRMVPELVACLGAAYYPRAWLAS
jgi:membrane associated rhomboid family serine protease